ncbi:MAG TPA: Uma2 family endonuclease [Myxococcaceae bacterium]|nr:Uma2 family endonuclease [Myxococcaceae bacterium]
MSSRSVCQVALEALPANMQGEIIAGELRVSRRPAILHAVASSRLGASLMGPFDLGEAGPGGWFILGRPVLRLSGDVLVPDLAGWRRVRMPVLPRAGASVHLAPDWACVLLSRASVGQDMPARLSVYAREGVSRVWLVDPEARSLEVLRLEGRRYVKEGVHAGTALVRAEPFDALELPLVGLWG